MSKSSNAPVGRILISNDDGLDAIGIAILAEIAARLSDDVWVIAPTGNRSGMSRAITLHSDVIIEPRGDNRFALLGDAERLRHHGNGQGHGPQARFDVVGNQRRHECCG